MTPSERKCAVDGCKKPWHCKGYCAMHYSRLVRHGSVDAHPLHDQVARFWAKVSKAGQDECWLWAGRLKYDGYGVATYNGRQWHAHRVAYWIAVGSIPTGYHIDHLCRVIACVNPTHLEAVSPQENRRRQTEARRQNPPTHCSRGHEYNDETRRVRPENPYWYVCRICDAQSAREARARRTA